MQANEYSAAHSLKLTINSSHSTNLRLSSLAANNQSKRRRTLTFQNSQKPFRVLCLQAQNALYRKYGNCNVKSILDTIDSILQKRPSPTYSRYKELKFSAAKNLITTFFSEGTQEEQLRILWNYYQFTIPVPFLLNSELFAFTFKFWIFCKRRREMIINDLIAQITEANIEMINIEYVRKLEARNHKSLFARQSHKNKKGKTAEEEYERVLDDIDESVEELKASHIEGRETNETTKQRMGEDDQTLMSFYHGLSGTNTQNDDSKRRQLRTSGIRERKVVKPPNIHRFDNFRAIWNFNYKKRVAALPIVRVSMASRDSRNNSQHLKASRVKEHGLLSSQTISLRSYRELYKPPSRRLIESKRTSKIDAESDQKPEEQEPLPEVIAEEKPIGFLNFLQNYVDKQKNQPSTTDSKNKAFAVCDLPASQKSMKNLYAKGLHSKERLTTQHYTSPPGKPLPFNLGFSTRKANAQTQMSKGDRTSSLSRPNWLKSHRTISTIGGVNRLNENACRASAHARPAGLSYMCSKERFSSRKAMHEELLGPKYRWTVTKQASSPIVDHLTFSKISSAKTSTNSSKERKLPFTQKPSLDVRNEYYEQQPDDKRGQEAVKFLFKKKNSIESSERDFNNILSTNNKEQSTAPLKTGPFDTASIFKCSRVKTASDATSYLKPQKLLNKAPLAERRFPQPLDELHSEGGKSAKIGFSAGR